MDISFVERRWVAHPNCRLVVIGRVDTGIEDLSDNHVYFNIEKNIEKLQY